jgi:hypothetical protein
MTTPTTREELIEFRARTMFDFEWKGSAAWDEADEDDVGYWLDHAALTLAAEEAAGVRCVPVEATNEMIVAGAAEYDPTWGYPNRAVGGAWAAKSLAAMIAFSPFAPERSEG